MSCFSSRSRLPRRPPPCLPVQLKCYRTVFSASMVRVWRTVGLLTLRTNGDGLQHWISVCSGLSSLSMSGGLSQSPKLRTVAITDICFFIFSIGRVVNGESCSCWLCFCWRRLVFILWADSGSRVGILIHDERPLRHQGPRNGIKSHTL